MSGYLRKPIYDPEVVLELVRRKAVVITGDVRRWLTSHGYDPVEAAIEVVHSAQDCGCYRKALILESGQRADVYGVDWDEEYWYLKYLIGDGLGFEAVIVLSCCWDGAPH